jgi:hypothetical protein
MILAPEIPSCPRLHAPLSTSVYCIYISTVPGKALPSAAAGFPCLVHRLFSLLIEHALLALGVCFLLLLLHPLSNHSPPAPLRSLCFATGHYRYPTHPSPWRHLPPDTLSVNTFLSHSFLSLVYLAFPFQLCLTEMYFASLCAYEHFFFTFHRDLIGVDRRKYLFLRVAISGCSSAALRRYLGVLNPNDEASIGSMISGLQT